jgi:hypothetical protein
MRFLGGRLAEEQFCGSFLIWFGYNRKCWRGICAQEKGDYEKKGFYVNRTACGDSDNRFAAGDTTAVVEEGEGAGAGGDM